MKILAIDYGEKRMGLAIGGYDIHKRRYLFATPLKPLIRKKNSHDIETIKKIIYEYDIQKIIIGYPVNMDGSTSAMTIKIEEFVEILKKKIGIDLETVDERLTSFEAEEMLKDLLPDYRKRKKSLDSIAALVILNKYLEKK